MPARMSCTMFSRESDAGPSVQTIFDRRKFTVLAEWGCRYFFATSLFFRNKIIHDAIDKFHALTE